MCKAATGTHFVKRVPELDILGRVELEFSQ